MTTTQIPTPASGGWVPQGLAGPLPPPTAASLDGGRLPRVRRQRRPALAAGGVLLVLVCATASAGVVLAGQDTTRVIALARDVQAGQVLTLEDLRVAELDGSGLTALSADGLSALVGQTATASLPAGTLLNSRMLSAAPLPAAGLQLVAVAVKPGGVPAEAVPGRDVMLLRVVTTADPTRTAEPAVLVAKARVVSVATESANGLVVLSVQVPQAAAPPVAQASAAGAVAVTLLPVTP
ncbi:MAG: SAF domain-containing protein [Mycobacteriales bacterium]|nr:SAF domain-containing protein [Mycobacteriales bacterium]